MYSKTIEIKVDKMFNDLELKVSSFLSGSYPSSEAIKNATMIVSSELAARSKSILSDMLFSLTNDLMETEFFSDIKRQNKFFEIDLRYEILSKYQFSAPTSVEYKETSKAVQALKVGGVTLAAGAAVEVGVVLIAGLSFSSLVPIPIGVLVAASIGAALTDYFAVEPARDKKNLKMAFKNYLEQAKKQFLNWFDEVEKYFNARVEEIKKTM